MGADNALQLVEKSLPQVVERHSGMLVVTPESPREHRSYSRLTAAIVS